jgi:hypothetical protein
VLRNVSFARRSFLIALVGTAYVCFCSVAHADYCRKQGGGVEACTTIPSSWTECGTFNGEALWCWPSGTQSHSASSKKDSKNMLIAVGVGLAFVGVMYYLFKTPPSKNNPGEVTLMAF